ncbi:conserved domain protein [Ruminococcus albus 8]|uniref:Conserved domain protein n=1 Tax=Ruminococcus albus 8 TaxID=246199 RepID=E9SBB1_RUMAL|nr:conserved domain protein [Ruminococcus albus 8]
MVIPLTHHKNSGYTTLNYPFVYRIFSWCAKWIVIFIIVGMNEICRYSGKNGKP